MIGDDLTGVDVIVTDTERAEDGVLLDRLQHAAFGYFLQTVNPGNGLVADTSRENAPSSIAVVGFALSVYPVAVERGWMARADAVDRSLAALCFFRDSDQSDSPEATGYKGFYYHFLDMHKGWKPECGFLHYGWEGYSEAIVLYVLALGSPTHPLTGDCYEAWTVTYQWENLYGHDFLYAGPLFVHRFSHAWIDFRGIQDRFMRQKRCDYFENSRRAAYIQREYAQRNPNGFVGYDEDCWGLSAGVWPSHQQARACQEVL